MNLNDPGSWVYSTHFTNGIKLSLYFLHSLVSSVAFTQVTLALAHHQCGYEVCIFIFILWQWRPGNSLMVLWLGLHALTAGGRSIPGGGMKIPQAAQHSQLKKEEEKEKKMEANKEAKDQNLTPRPHDSQCSAFWGAWESWSSHILNQNFKYSVIIDKS